MRLVVAGGGAVVVVLGVVAAIGYLQLRGVASRLTAAQAQVDRVQAEVRQGDVGPATASLDAVESSLIRADGELHGSRVLSIGDIVPVVSQNLAALRDSVGLALRLVDGGRQVLAAARPLEDQDGKLGVPLRSGTLPLAAVATVQSRLAQVASELSGPGPDPPGRWLLGPVARAQREVAAKAAAARRQFQTASEVLGVLDGLVGADGPQRILVAVSNDAEMRGSGGMILSYAVLDTAGGHLSFERSGPIDDLDLSRPAPVKAPADYSGRFASLEPTRLWRNANLASDFTRVGPVLAGMYRAATGKRVDDVVQIDSSALADILAGIGPVTVPGLGPVGSANAVAVTLNQQYLQFPGRSARKEALHLLTDAVVRHLLSGTFTNVAAVANGLSQAVAGRHLMLWSADAGEERGIAAMGAAGGLPALGADFAQLTVQNFSANKLDYYLGTRLSLTGQRPPDRLGHVQATITLDNTAPTSGTNTEVFGPFSPGLRRGQYVGFVSLYLPPGWYLTGSTGTPAGTPSVAAEDGKTVMELFMKLDAGQSASVTLDLETPPPAPGASFELVPSPRVLPTVADVHLTEGSSVLAAHAALTRALVVPAARPAP